jgi:hypothetical protein
MSVTFTQQNGNHVMLSARTALKSGRFSRDFYIDNIKEQYFVYSYNCPDFRMCSATHFLPSRCRRQPGARDEWHCYLGFDPRISLGSAYSGQITTLPGKAIQRATIDYSVALRLAAARSSAPTTSLVVMTSANSVTILLRVALCSASVKAALPSATKITL